jgi:hypothetical protein
MHIHTRRGIPPEGGEPMKYPRYVYKRINGQEYYCGVGDSFLEEMKEKTLLRTQQSKTRKHLNSVYHSWSEK